MSVAKRSSEADWIDGKAVHASLHKSVWFVVDGTRGRITNSFDTTLMPNDWIPVPGPARDRRSGRLTASTSVRPADRAKVAAFNADTGLRQAVYFNEDAGAYQPAAGVLIRWDIWDTIDHSHYGASSVYTDSNGYFTAPCVDYNMYADGEAQFWNSYVNVTPYGGYGEGTGSCTSPFSVLEVPR